MQKHVIKLLIAFQLVTVPKLFAQNIALNATGSLPDTSAMLDVSSSNKGFLMPRMTTAQVNAIPLPATGLIVYNTTISAFQVNSGTSSSPSWQTLGTTTGNWLTGGNSGTNSGQKFLGTTDNVSMRFKTNNTQSMVLDSLGNVGIGSSPSFSSAADKFLVDAGSTNSYNVITAKGTVNNYLQLNVQNLSSGTAASSDVVATADNGSETSNFVDMGVNGSGYTGGVMGSANDAYLFNNGNNLLIGTGSASKSLVFMTGGTAQSTYERMRIDGSGNVGVGTTSPGSKMDVKGTLRLSGSTSGYVGFAPAAAAGSTTYTLPTADGTSGQQLTTNGAGVLSWAAAGSGSGSTTVSNTSSTNTLTTTVNGVAATGVNIINSNSLSTSGSNLTSTVNGVASTVNLSGMDSDIYKTDGTLLAARTVTMGTNNLTFGSTTGNLIFNPSSTGKVGIGTTTPGSTLDVKGTIRMSGATSGYVGFAPAAAAGSTTYTLPSVDGTSGQVLSTNGSGTLSWATAAASTSANNGLTVSSNTVKLGGNLTSATTVTNNGNAFSIAGSGQTTTFASNGNVGIGTTSPNYALHIHDATVNPSGGTWMQISNNASGSGSYDGFYYGVSAAGAPQIWADGNLDIITGSGTTNDYAMHITSAGNVGIGNTSPSYTLDVTGTARVTGALKVGAYTLPSTDGTSGQQLTTNGSGTLSWSSAGSSSSGWGLTGNSGTSSSNFIGTTDNNDVAFKRYNTAAGTLGATTTSFGVSTTASSTNATAIGYSANASAKNSTALGYSASIQPTSNTSTDNIAIGNADVSGSGITSYATAIGSSAQVQGSNSMAIGRAANVNANTTYAIAFGDAAQAQANYSTVIGANAYSNATSAVAIGGGGSSNKTQAQGNYSVAVGYYSYTDHQDAIAIGDHAQAQGTNTTVIGTNLYNGTANTVAIGNSSVTSFLMNGASATSGRALVVGSGNTNGNGAYLTTGGTWTNASDRNLKDDFTTVDNNDILNKVSKLDITKWKYKGTDEYHIGPMAQDFYAAFSLGTDNKHISTIDPAGIALASIKALKKQNDDLNEKVAQQQLQIDQMQKEIDEIKAKMK